MSEAGKLARTRLTVEFPEPLYEKLLALTSELEVTQTEIIRRGVAMFYELHMLKKEGFGIGGWRDSEDTKERAIIVY